MGQSSCPLGKILISFLTMFRKYEDFDVRDFVSDAYFWKWVKAPSRETEEFWETWMRLHPEKKSAILEARRLLRAIDFKKTSHEDINADALLHRIRGSIEMSQPVAPAPIESSWQWSRVAAALLAIFVSGFVLYYVGNTLYGQVNVKTAYDENETVVLPDSSVVVLNANSKIEYARHWSDEKTREVWLTGEAFFKVQKSPGKGNAKFVVHTTQVSVEVLGTEFDVTDRRGKTVVILNSGKVKLKSEKASGHEIMMVPGELAELSSDNKFVKRSVNTSLYSAWKEGKFIFNKTSLNDIIQIIEDTYGYTVQLDVAGIGDETFTGIIPTKNLDTLLKVLSESYDVTITKSDGQLRISR